MSAKYKVSVIIPIYNVAEYLEECLESMVRQTIDSLEVIMVDDGSTDISGVIAQGDWETPETMVYSLFTVTILSSLILMILCRMAHMKRCTKRL